MDVSLISFQNTKGKPLQIKLGMNNHLFKTLNEFENASFLIQAALILHSCLAVGKIAVSFSNTNLCGTEWNEILVHPLKARSIP